MGKLDTDHLLPGCQPFIEEKQSSCLGRSWAHDLSAWVLHWFQLLQWCGRVGESILRCLEPQGER